MIDVDRPISELDALAPAILTTAELRERRRPDLVGLDGLIPASFCDDIILHVMRHNHLPEARLRHASNIYVYQDVVFTFNGSAIEPFEGNWRTVDRPARGPNFLDRARREFAEIDRMRREEAGAFFGSAGSANYGHWLVDDLTRICVAGSHILGRKIILSSHNEAIDRVRLESVSVVQAHAEVGFIDRERFTLIADAIFVDPVSMHPILKSQIALARLRQEVLGKIRPSNATPRRIFVDRGNCSYRSILNRGELEEFCATQGFDLVRPEELSFEDQVNCFRNADIIIGIMGAAMTNIIFSKPTVKTLFLAPEGWIEPFYWDLCDTLNIDYKAYYGNSTDLDRPTHLRNFSIDPSGLAAALQFETADQT